MEIIATIPAPHQADTVRSVASHPYVAAVRFNVGARSKVPPFQTLQQLQAFTDGKPLWIDLKGRQLRITKFADIAFDPITLNHDVKVDLPATIILRNGTAPGIALPITAVYGREVHVDVGDRTRFIVGAGQSVNIHGANLRIEGYLTKIDYDYCTAAKCLGINKFMLSFVEQSSDIDEIRRMYSDSELVLKIETAKGINAFRHANQLPQGTHLMAARDDLFVNLPDRRQFIDAIMDLLSIDPYTIIASRILTSLIDFDIPSLGDISDLHILKQLHAKRIMLCDDLCESSGFDDAMDTLVHWWQL